MVYLFLAWFIACALHLVEAATPDKNAILTQLKKNGACCTALAYFLPNQTHFNDILDTGYSNSQLSFWSAQEQSLKPTCIVIPTSAQDVSTAVTILYVAYQASIAGCKYAVRGAGHTPHAGAANINGGVTIDMQSMNQVTVAATKKSVSVGPGNRWGAVYPTLDDMDLTMVGGRLSPVGVGGLLTGGGISFFSGRYGFACDNIQQYELVLGNGTITTASSNTNPSLFRALKGGNNNFGIVTRFDAKVYPQSSFWGGIITQPMTNKEAVFDFFVKFSQSANYDPFSALITNFAWIAGSSLTSLIVLDVEYTNGSVTWPPPAFAPLDAMLKVATTVRKDKLSSFTTEIGSTNIATSGHNNFFSTLTFINKPDVAPEFLREAFKLVDATANSLTTVVGLIYTFTLQPLPYVLYSKASTSNALGLDRFKDDLANILFTLSWTLPTDNDRVYSAIQKLQGDIIALAKEKGIYNEWLYLNYASQFQDPIKAYGSASVAFLKSVSKQYDPAGVFQKAVPGGFKLGL
ncbi:FAD-binding domain-containing protein [Polyplosphaeria fusca]|uniref:FAD-binding domain-containing protein n=1 Tax=Polyplosphaeria fusca TaxID=682080 RepID=A0A9P4R140_9PLEO|nr:FAD-binding domain-containing protein [Polyplosphaeria fusca]